MDDCYAQQVREVALRQALEDAKREEQAARDTYLTDDGPLAA